VGILIDASVLIDFERGRLDLERRIHGRELDCVLSVVAVSELLHGVHRAVDPHIRTRRLALVEGLLLRFSLEPIDLHITRVHAQMWANLAARGIGMAAHDRWLAATCLARNHSIATANLREFTRVPGLSIEHWV